VALPAEIITQKAETVIPVRDMRFLRVLRQPSVLLKPLRHGRLEVLGFCFGVLAEDHDGIISVTAVGDEPSGKNGGKLLPERQGVLDLGTEPFRGLPAQRNLPPQLRTPPDKIALVTGILRVGPGVLLLGSVTKRLLSSRCSQR
jgi:hypothetical protein